MSNQKLKNTTRESRTKALPLYRRIANFVISAEPNKVSIMAITSEFNLSKSELSTELNKLKDKDSPVYCRVKELMY